MIVIKGSVYVHSHRGYTKCVLHKRQLQGQDVYNLVETKVVISELPEDYEVLTYDEVIARYGAGAAINDAESEVR